MKIAVEGAGKDSKRRLVFVSRSLSGWAEQKMASPPPVSKGQSQ